MQVFPLQQLQPILLLREYCLSALNEFNRTSGALDFADTNLAPRSEKSEKIEKGSAREFTQSLEIRGLKDGASGRD